MKKVVNLIGLIIGIAMIITGIVFAIKPAKSYSISTTRSASFGADFYTFEYQATAASADNAASAAKNVSELGEKLAKYFGFAFIFSGCLVTLHYLPVSADSNTFSRHANVKAEFQKEKEDVLEEKPSNKFENIVSNAEENIEEDEA